MKDQVAELAQRGISLSPQDRARLAELLLASIEEPVRPDVEAAWDAEIERRLAAYDRGDLKAIDAEDVFAKATRLAR
jgi:putative addiction module component (TIGR02574 family)